MGKFSIFCLLTLGPLVASAGDYNVTIGDVHDEAEAARVINAVEPWVSQECTIRAEAAWGYKTNLTDENEKASVDATLAFTNFHRTKFFPIFGKFDWTRFKDPTLKRIYRFESLLGASALTDERLKEFAGLENTMTNIYSTAKVPNFHDPSKPELPLDPDINEVFAKSRDPEELKHYWLNWRELTGKKMPKLYQDWNVIAKEVATLNGYHDVGQLWRRSFENPLFPLHLWALYGQIRPLYEQIHAYVRRKLYNKYGEKSGMNLRGTIPAHLLGNMWAQNWGNILDIVIPYPKGPGVADFDVSGAMVAQNYTVMKMFEMADDFFRSLGFDPVNEIFWRESYFERPPPPRQIVCHPEAWDMCDGKHFRIKMCSTVAMRDFVTIHHEMGHIQYFMSYKGQKASFREGANPGFHEAIGDTIALSVGSPGHLEKIGLLKNYENNEKNTINFLLDQALKMFVDLPWEVLVDQWRWDVFEGKVNATQYNCRWWDYRSQIQGIRPPTTRSHEDFDPGAKFHIPSMTPYDRYFVARILNYQFHDALCREAKQYNPDDPNSKPLHLCSVYGSKEAGKKLQDMLKLGSSVPWPLALEKVTGTRRMDARSILNYFAPLVTWLKKENEKNGEFIGWEDDEPEELCTPKYPYI